MLGRGRDSNAATLHLVNPCCCPSAWSLRHLSVHSCFLDSWECTFRIWWFWWWFFWPTIFSRETERRCHTFHQVVLDLVFHLVVREVAGVPAGAQRPPEALRGVQHLWEGQAGVEQ